MADALSAHEDALGYGGRPGILNLALIESAVARPYIGYCRPLWMKAGSIAQSMAGNHGFVDGNKRTALILIHLLVDGSGYELQPVGDENIEEAIEGLILQIAGHQIEIDEINAWFRGRVKRIKKAPL